METGKILFCNCGWSGVTKFRHSYEKYDITTTRILHAVSSICKSCSKEIYRTETVLNKSDISQETKQYLGVNLVVLPYTFKTKKFELEILEDSFNIYSMDVTDATRSKNIFRSKNRIENFGEVFYEIILNPITPGKSFSVEYRVTDSEIDSFCEYLLDDFTVRHKLPKLPFAPSNPAPNPYTNNPAMPLPPFDPNKIPWSPNKVTTPYFPKPNKKIDPYAEDILKKWMESQKHMEDDDMPF